MSVVIEPSRHVRQEVAAPRSERSAPDAQERSMRLRRLEELAAGGMHKVCCVGLLLLLARGLPPGWTGAVGKAARAAEEERETAKRRRG
jgi:hypothetical protein